MKMKNTSYLSVGSIFLFITCITLFSTYLAITVFSSDRTTFPHQNCTVVEKIPPVGCNSGDFQYNILYGNQTTYSGCIEPNYTIGTVLEVCYYDPEYKFIRIYPKPFKIIFWLYLSATLLFFFALIASLIYLVGTIICINNSRYRVSKV